VHAHVFEKSHSTQLSKMFKLTGRYCIDLVYGMVDS
jgi:hypothetical protein